MSGFGKAKALRVGMDRLSELPDPIIDIILSYLPTVQEIVRTKILSRRWSGISYSMIRMLRFDEWQFGLRTSALFKARGGGGGDDDCTTFESYFDVIMRCLRENEVHINKFELQLVHVSYRDRDQIVDRWMKMAIESFADEIIFQNWGQRNLWFPKSLLAAKSLKLLEIGPGVAFPDELFGIRLDSLTRLHLRSVIVKEDVLQCIISHCPNLEDLFLSPLSPFMNAERLQLAINHQKVKYINTSYLGGVGVDVEAPMLERLTLQIGAFMPSKFIAMNNLRFLEIRCERCSSTLTLEAFLYLNIPRFPMLETLNLRSKSLVELLVESHSIRVINWDFDEYPETALDIDAPNLSRLYLSCLNWDPVGSPFFYDLRDMLNKIPLCQSLYINCAYPCEMGRKEIDIGIFEDPKELFRVLELDHLMLDVNASCPISFSVIVASLFWMCRPKFLSFGSTSTRGQHLELFRKELKATPDCCGGSEFKCWRHYLKDVCEISYKEIEAAKPRSNCYDPYYAKAFRAQGDICLKLNWDCD